jgi:hypothetical protein
MATPSVDGAKYWFNGLPVDGLQQSTKDTGATKYWYNGLPVDFLASYGAPPAANTKRTFGIIIQ